MSGAWVCAGRETKLGDELKIQSAPHNCVPTTTGNGMNSPVPDGRHVGEPVLPIERVVLTAWASPSDTGARDGRQSGVATTGTSAMTTLCQERVTSSGGELVLG